MCENKRKSKILKAAALFLWCMIAVGILTRPAVAAEGVASGLTVCCTAVIPSLFPFFVLAKLIAGNAFSTVPGLLLLPVTRWLGLRSRRAPAALLLGLFCGFGGGASAVQTLYEEGQLSAREAELLLCCATNAGPAFVVSGVGALMLGSVQTGWLIFGALSLASLFTVFLLGFWRRTTGLFAVNDAAGGIASPESSQEAPVLSRAFSSDYSKESENAHAQLNKRKKHTQLNLFATCVSVKMRAAPVKAFPVCAKATPTLTEAASAPAPTAPKAPAASALRAFTEAMRSGVLSTLFLCGYVVAFSLFLRLVLSADAPAQIRYCAAALLEVTAACRTACTEALRGRAYLCCAAISTIGLSVFLQLRALLDEKIRLAPLVFSRLLHCPLSLLVLSVLFRLFPSAVSASASLTPRLRMPADALVIVFLFCATFFCLFPAPKALRSAKNALE